MLSEAPSRGAVEKLMAVARDHQPTIVLSILCSLTVGAEVCDDVEDGRRHGHIAVGVFFLVLQGNDQPEEHTKHRENGRIDISVIDIVIESLGAVQY